MPPEQLAGYSKLADELDAQEAAQAAQGRSLLEKPLKTDDTSGNGGGDNSTAPPPPPPDEDTTEILIKHSEWVSSLIPPILAFLLHALCLVVATIWAVIVATCTFIVVTCAFILAFIVANWPTVVAFANRLAAALRHRCEDLDLMQACGRNKTSTANGPKTNSDTGSNGGANTVTRNNHDRMWRSCVIGFIVCSMIFWSYDHLYSTLSSSVPPTTMIHITRPQSDLAASMYLYHRTLSQVEETSALGTNEMHRLQQSRADIQSAIEQCEGLSAGPVAACLKTHNVHRRLPDLLPQIAGNGNDGQWNLWVLWRWICSSIWSDGRAEEREVRFFAEHVILAADHASWKERMRLWGVEGETSGTSMMNMTGGGDWRSG